jgi:hypothetical protein
MQTGDACNASISTFNGNLHNSLWDTGLRISSLWPYTNLSLIWITVAVKGNCETTFGESCCIEFERTCRNVY